MLLNDALKKIAELKIEVKGLTYKMKKSNSWTTRKNAYDALNKVSFDEPEVKAGELYVQLFDKYQELRVLKGKVHAANGPVCEKLVEIRMLQDLNSILANMPGRNSVQVHTQPWPTGDGCVGALETVIETKCDITPFECQILIAQNILRIATLDAEVNRHSLTTCIPD